MMKALIPSEECRPAPEQGTEDKVPAGPVAKSENKQGERRTFHRQEPASKSFSLRAPPNRCDDSDYSQGYEPKDEKPAARQSDTKREAKQYLVAMIPMMEKLVTGAHAMYLRAYAWLKLVTIWAVVRGGDSSW